MGQALIIVLDERDDLVIQVIYGTEVASANHFAGQGAEPDLHLIQPGRMRRGEVKDETFAGLREEGPPLGACGHGRQRTPAQLGDGPACCFVPMSVEIVKNEVDPLGFAIMAADRFNEIREDLRRPVIGEMSVNLSGGDFQTGGQTAGAVTDVLVFDSFEASGPRRFVRIPTLERLDAGLLVDTENDLTSFGQSLGLQVKVDDRQHLRLEVGIGAMQPVVPALRFDRGLVEQSPYRRPADGRDDPIDHGGLSEVRGTPVGHRNAVLDRWPSGQGHDLMLLVRGKTSAVGRDAGGP
jgi:hypothetical protein